MKRHRARLTNLPVAYGPTSPPLEVSSIWEIGSRDGEDARALLDAFPLAHLDAFEPNPDTFSIVESVAATRRSRMTAHNIALTESDGTTTLYKIDRERTKTTWQDGNPGASSLFRASGAYSAHEDYVQVPVSVAGRRASTLITEEQLAVPQLVWIDVQGAELSVLRGFHEALSTVSAIYLELSLKEIYEGQALAPDVVSYLRPLFAWHSVLRTGEWQFDALLVSRDLADSRLRWRDALLRRSLSSRVNAGVAYPLKPPDVLVGLGKQVEPLLRKHGTRQTGDAARVLGSAYTRISHKSLPLRLRQVTETLQPNDPLASSQDLPEIDVIIPCHRKDLPVLSACVSGALTGSANPIRDVQLLVEDAEVQLFSDSFPGCSVIPESQLLTPALVEALKSYVPPSRINWVKQQLLKFRGAMFASSEASLVVDADTVLLTQRVWLDSQERQILCLVREFHAPYNDQAVRMWGPSTAAPVSFVAHHQLMQKSLLRQMFGVDDLGLARWMSLGGTGSAANVSEYHSYGAWVSTHHPHRALWAQWRNASVSRRWLVETSTIQGQHQRLKRLFPSCNSVSLHDYQDTGTPA
ncbi:MAG: FkbM family methyltransferase [Candidatus Nanopelagicales bacterium]